MTPMRLLSAAILLALVMSMTAREVAACQAPPWVPCELLSDVTLATHGDLVRVHFTITNMPPVAGGPAVNDLSFVIRASARGSDEGCSPWGEGGPDDIDEPVATVTLDDATSAEADGPTTWSGSFDVRLIAPTNQHVVLVTACADQDGDGICERTCQVAVCIRTSDDPSMSAFPDASFERPATCARPGDVVPLAVRVRRNGYPAGRPLTVQVIPGNPNDPLDLFPIDPPEIVTLGAVVTGEEELLEFSCGVHGPCFAGVSNSYEVRILDAALVVWDSRWTSPREQGSGLGAVRVCEVPPGLSSVEEVLDDGGDGRLSPCEHGRLRLRVIARNPSLDGRLEDLRIEQVIPDGLRVVDHSLHFHDNPMDSDSPTPAELTATGSFRVEGDRVIVDTPFVETRFAGGGPPVRVFRDLFELDLLLETPSDGLRNGSELLIPGAVVSGRLGGRLVETVTDEIRLELPVVPPGEVSAPASSSPLLVRGREALLSWEAAPRLEYDLFRGELSELSSTNYGRCWRPGLSETELSDSTPPPSGGGWFYLVRAASCGGEGTGGSDSLLRVRPLRDRCR